MAALDGPAWLRDRRAAAFERYEAAGLPTEAEEPVVVVHWVDAAADGSSVFPRTIVRAGEASEVTVLDYLASSDVSLLAGPLVELVADAAAFLRYCNVQELGPRVWQVGYQAS